MAGAGLTLTPGTEVEFLTKYREDVTRLTELLKAYKTAVEAPPAKSTTGTVTEYVQAYADKNNMMLDAHEAVQRHVETMQQHYVQYGVPAVTALGHINNQVAFLKNLDEVKRQASTNLREANLVQPTVKDIAAREELCNFADSTTKSRHNMTIALEDGKTKDNIDALSYAYQRMWRNTYMRDRRYAERLHRLALEGRGRYSAYDINGRTGFNFQFREFFAERVGVEGELNYIARMQTHAGIFSIVRWAGMQQLGQFSVTRTEYADKDGQPLKDLNGNPVRGPAHTMIMPKVSVYGGYGNIAKHIFKSNDEARVMQALYALGGLLSSHVNNTAILLNEEAIKQDPNISEDHRKSLLEAKASAKAQAKDFREKGITIDEIAPGYAGVDFYYQMQAIANTMGIPFNKNGPTLEALLQNQMTSSTHKPARYSETKYALAQVRKRGASMQAAVQKNLEESTMKTKEYKSLRDYTVTQKLIDKYKSYENFHPNSAEKKLYDTYTVFEDRFNKHNPQLIGSDGKIKDAEAYAKAYAAAMKKEFGNDYKAIQAEVEKPGSPERAELHKNAVGARGAGREDWYRHLKDAVPGVTLGTEGKADPNVTASNAGKSASDARDALRIAASTGGDTSEKNHEKDLEALDSSKVPTLIFQGKKPADTPKIPLPNTNKDDVNIVVDVSASKPKI